MDLRMATWVIIGQFKILFNLKNKSIYDFTLYSILRKKANYICKKIANFI